ncbi:MAG: iron ABC transporter [Gemmataceae bacterium]
MLSPAESVVLLTGILVACCCALPGCFLLLRRMALLGDAISHAILPGIALAFALTHSRNIMVMLAGALAAGLACVALIQILGRPAGATGGGLPEDAATAVVFPAFFALGVVLIGYVARHVDLDPDCVIYGSIELAPLQELAIGSLRLGPRPLWILGAAALINLLFVTVLYKELKLACFDPDLAALLGFRPRALHWLLVMLVGGTTVACFEAVGAILVVSFLVLPPATAYLLTHRLTGMLVLSVSVGALAAVLGYVLAVWINSNVAGAMGWTAGLLFVCAWVFAPKRGLAANLVRRLRGAAEG